MRTDIEFLLAETELMIEDARAKAYGEAPVENDRHKNSFFRGCEQTLLHYQKELRKILDEDAKNNFS